MFRNILDRLKEAGAYLMQSRLVTLIIIFCVSSSILIGRLFYLQIVKGSDYLENYEYSIRRTTSVAATRGNIYDRNGNLLAYNQLAYSVTINLSTVENSITTDKRSEKNAALNKILDQVLSIVESNGDSVVSSFGIILDSSGTYQFTQSSDTQKLRFIADVYGKRTIDELTEKQQNQSAADIIHYLCTDEKYGYGLDDSTLEPAYILKIINMRYAMALNAYQQYIDTVLASDVSDETAAAIMENKDVLTGVDISEDSIRKYTDGMYFASIIGYTGQISQDEYDALDKDEKKKYSLSDIVGKAGIEQSMDNVLQGKKGETTVYVDNLGRVTDTVSRKDPEAGNDVYLTIDKNLQESTYKLLEEKIAGIVLSKLQNVLEYDTSSVDDSKNLIIPVSDAYYNLIGNAVIDSGHFSSSDAKTAEQQVYSIFQEKSVEKTIYRFMTEKMGLNTAAACGILANVERECDFRIHLTSYDGGYGIVQWTGSRNRNLKNWCKKNGYDYQSLEGQLRFLEYELEGGYSKILKKLRKIENSPAGAYEAAYYFCYNFEIPANRTQNSVRRGNIAKNTYWKKYAS